MRLSDYTLTGFLVLGWATTSVLAAPVNIGTNDLTSTTDIPQGLLNGQFVTRSDIYAHELADALSTAAPIDKRAPMDPRNPVGLVYSVAPEDWPTDAQLTQAFNSTVGKDKAWIWTGRIKDVKGASVIASAVDFATKTGGTTLEMAILAAGFKMPDPKTSDDIFAQAASGTVHVVRGESTRPGNIWDNIELPRLKKTGHVTQVIQVQPMTPEVQTVLWTALQGDETSTFAQKSQNPFSSAN